MGAGLCGCVTVARRPEPEEGEQDNLKSLDDLDRRRELVEAGASKRELSRQDAYTGSRWWNLDRTDAPEPWYRAYDQVYSYDSASAGANVDIYCT